MDALIGLVGTPSPTLMQSMARTLAHRGEIDSSGVTQTPRASFARLEWSDRESVGCKVASRLHHDDGLVVQICGYITKWTPEPSSVGALRHVITAGDFATRYRERGLDGFCGIQGAALIAVRDDRLRQTHLVRVGCGVQTVFYGRIFSGEAKYRWLIASESKAIMGSPSFQRRIRPAAIAQYLSFSFVPGEGTMLENLFELPAGHAVTFEDDSLTAPKLRDLFPFEQDEWRHDSDSQLDDRHWVDQTKRVVAKAVASRLPKNEPVGVFLSGGLDSSIVAAEVAKQHRGPVLTYALHFGDAYPNELAFAKSVADRLGTKHHEVLIRPKEFSKRLAEMIWHLDDPIGDPITQPNFELARRVSQDVHWVFNGEGGDPLFGGPKNLPMMMTHWYGIQREPGFREKAYLASYRRAYEECSRVLHPRWLRKIDFTDHLESVLRPFFDESPLTYFLNKLMAINIRLKGAHLILPKVERMLAASKLTPLSPLFDEEVTRLSFQMPPKLKLRHGEEKWVLKEAYRDELPAEVISRPKSGMRVPVHHWFRGEMKRTAKKILLSRQTRAAELFDHDRVRSLLRYDIEEGAGRYGMRLWMLMTLELWRRNVFSK